MAIFDSQKLSRPSSSFINISFYHSVSRNFLLWSTNLSLPLKNASLQSFSCVDLYDQFIFVGLLYECKKSPASNSHSIQSCSFQNMSDRASVPQKILSAQFKKLEAIDIHVCMSCDRDMSYFRRVSPRFVQESYYSMFQLQ